MIVAEFYDGAGLGNQLWNYAVLRAIAWRNNCDWGLKSRGSFKGKSFMELPMGKRIFGRKCSQPSSRLPLGIKNYYKEMQLFHHQEGYDITPLDHEIFKIGPRTKIDGYLQSEDYIFEFKDEISSLMRHPEYQESDNNLCLIHFRGGDFAPHPTLLLSPKYYRDAMSHIKSLSPSIEFKIITNDVGLAQKYFPTIEIISDYKIGEIESGPHTSLDNRIGDDFGKLQSAKYLIISNSSYSWWAAWTNPNLPFVVAPKYWARHNKNDGYWSTGDILTRNWNYLDIDGALFTYEQCLRERNEFRQSEEYLKNLKAI